MRESNIVIGEYYRHKNTPHYAWAKVLSVIQPHIGVNTHGYKIAKCEWSVGKNDPFGFIKYFKLSDLIKGASLLITALEHRLSLIKKRLIGSKAVVRGLKRANVR